MIEFKRKPNTEWKINGKTIWESRSVAVVGVIVAKYFGDIYVLIEKRSQTMMDQPGKWCLPCGYMDWDEDGWQALLREVYEETSFWIPDHYRNLINKNQRQPFYVHTDPKENRQNIVLIYGIAYDFKEGLPLSILSYKNEEIEEIKWVKLNQLDKYDFAFNHERRIFQAEEFFSSSLFPWWKRIIKKRFFKNFHLTKF